MMLGLGSSLVTSNAAAGGLPPMSLVAMGPGDSQIAFGDDDMTQTGQFWGFLRFFLGSQIEMVPNDEDGQFPFATGGQTIQEFGPNADKVVAARGSYFFRYAFEMGGTNNALQLGDMEAAAEAMRDEVINPLKDAGIIPIIFAPYPIPQATTFEGNDNNTWEMSDKIVELRGLLAALCVERNVPYIDANSVLESAPGRGIAAMYATDDNPHLSPKGLAIYARAAAPMVSAIVRTFNYDPEAGAVDVSTNADFAVGTNSPTGYTYFTPATNSTAMVTVGTDRHWELTIAADGNVNVWAASNPIESTDGKTCDSTMVFEVVSGEVQLRNYSLASAFNTAVATDLSSGESRRAAILPSDGVKRLRTPRVLLSGVANAIPQFDFTAGAAGAVLRIRKMTVRKYP